ncbi:MAG: Gfo/Idh/MocA family oxidoreductase [Caldilineales bacterium]|nr:Gfo/Idh/MocA family oxidoreductase [Caldilineales bacterium]
MLKIGILGAGFMGATHAEAFAQVPDVQIVGISSRSTEKAHTLAGKYDARPFTDALALATDPDIDAVSNTLPTYLHKDLTLAALEAGKHVLLEKPMGLSVEECDELIAVAKQSNRVLMIGQTLRFWPEYMAISEFLKSGQLGKPLAATATRRLGPPRWAEWFLDPKLSGGEVLDLHIHDLDMLNWLFGSPKNIYTRGQRSPETGGWDLAMSLIDYGDVKAFAEGNALQPPEYPFTMTLTVLCERGSIEFSFRAGGVQVDSRDAGGSGLTVYEHGKSPYGLEFEAGDGYVNMTKHFVESIRLGRACERGTPEQGRLAVATALAARRSIETDQVVSF